MCKSAIESNDVDLEKDLEDDVVDKVVHVASIARLAKKK